MRIVVCGDDGVGKSSLITALVKDRFVPHIEDVLPPLFIPRGNITVTVVDTSAQLSARNTLKSELRQANVLWLVFSDHYTCERISLFWMPFLRSIGVNLPVILCQNKCDADSAEQNDNDDDEVLNIMNEFKEIDSFIRCSAKDKFNVSETFYLCQRAVTYPLAPLFDAKEGQLKPAAVSALRRIFFLCDQDQTEYMTDLEFLQLQFQCFQSSLDQSDIESIHRALLDRSVDPKKPLYIPGKGITCDGFVALAQLYAEQGRHETVWGILRHFHYTDSLCLDERYLCPSVDVPTGSHVELSPNGYRFLVDLFTLFDKDDDGGLSPDELDILFAPTPGFPKLWTDTQFPYSTVRNERGYVTLQGWLAQWSMTAFLNHQTAFAYLAMLGYESKYGAGKLTSAIRITKAAKPRNPRSKIYRNVCYSDRNVFNCFVLGASGSGKSVLLSSFLGRSSSYTYSPTITMQMMVNSVEMPGGKQCYLILEELGELEPAILENPQKLAQCDVLCFCYDSSDPESFSYLTQLREKYRQLDQLPVVYAALKADLDRQQQRTDVQPDRYTTQIGLAAPLHVSAEWPSSLSALFVQLVDAAMRPGPATPQIADMPEEDSVYQVILAIGTTAMAAGVAYLLWRRSL
ncbi:Mitochondrial Rho GTPase 1 [Wickerhamiella sorbophila]|uniref:Mitochondrial Rho GTPase n=1 Tax=Wickerhamiella sorbophila TaxID=45607 RepID=A0A2T0FLR7_9ASCO|nr:Mitochondrial Rho GTPase 1 [Wickerhamiella sorbophila]PRT55922.1 Mitochondrial Rho GTPase 1 [Wickerhamiella sorbophila]